MNEPWYMAERTVLVNSSATKAMLISFYPETWALSWSPVAVVLLQKPWWMAWEKEKGKKKQWQHLVLAVGSAAGPCRTSGKELIFTASSLPGKRHNARGGGGGGGRLCPVAHPVSPAYVSPLRSQLLLPARATQSGQAQILCWNGCPFCRAACHEWQAARQQWERAQPTEPTRQNKEAYEGSSMTLC